MSVVVVSSILVAGASGTAAAQSEHAYGSPDDAFNRRTFIPQISNPVIVTDIALQNDGKVLAVGSFPGGIRRFLSNGSRDRAFNRRVPAAKLQQQTLSVAVQPDSKILVGGYFKGALLRLNAGGSQDRAFNAAAATSTPRAVTALGLQKNGGIIVGSSARRQNLLRLDSTGALDTEFTTNANAALDESTDWWRFGTEVNSVVVQPNGKILVAGSFRQKLMRLNDDGTPDAAFSANLGAPFNWSIDNIALQRDGKIIVVGNFDGLVRRVNADGTLDAAFNATLGRQLDPPIEGITEEVVDAVVQANGSILIAGCSLQVRHQVMELRADGSIDKSFASTPLGQVENVANTIALQRNSNIIIGGYFAGELRRYYGLNAGRQGAKHQRSVLAVNR